MKKAEPLKKQEMRQKIGEMDAFLGYWLRLVSNQITASFQQRLSEKKVSVAEWLALRFLYSHAPCSLTTLAKEMGMNKGAVSRLAQSLEERHLIKRTVTANDHRLFSIELTADGVELVPALAEIAEQNDLHFFGHLSKKELESTFELLKDMVNRHGFKTKPLK